MPLSRVFTAFCVVLLLQKAACHGSGPTEQTDDCRNRTWQQDGGDLVVMSWHIHYTTNTTDQPRFYGAFINQFKDLFPPASHTADGQYQCPFGPNFGANSYKWVCSLEGKFTPDELAAIADLREGGHGGSPWGDLPQRAFFIPVEHIYETWEWAKKERGAVDIIKHPNTGCMHDDHSLRAQWVASKGSCDPPTCHTNPSVPAINILDFPCNKVHSGCNDSLYDGPPACGCTMPVKSDSPKDACKGCISSFDMAKWPLVPGCSTLPLGVEYKITNGLVQCGNTFDEKDIGGGINIAPKVTYEKAVSGKLYTIVMIDPDADLAHNGSWPAVTKPGSHAPVRHWVMGNIDGEILKSGLPLNGTVVSAFVGPSPPWGSHRYGQFLFEQPAGRIRYEKISGAITNWDYGDFIVKNELGFAVASNWHLTQHSDSM